MCYKNNVHAKCIVTTKNFASRKITMKHAFFSFLYKYKFSLHACSPSFNHIHSSNPCPSHTYFHVWVTSCYNVLEEMMSTSRHLYISPFFIQTPRELRCHTTERQGQHMKHMQCKSTFKWPQCRKKNIVTQQDEMGAVNYIQSTEDAVLCLLSRSWQRQ